MYWYIDDINKASCTYSLLISDSVNLPCQQLDWPLLMSDGVCHSLQRSKEEENVGRTLPAERFQKRN